MISWMNKQGCLKIAVSVYYPFIFMSQNGPPYDVTGSMTEILDILSKSLDFCYEYVVPDDKQFGQKYQNGSWSGLIGLLVRKEADMTGVVVGLDLQRTPVMDFSDFLYMDKERLVYKRPMLESDMAGFVKPYTATSWVMVLVTMVAVATLVLLTSPFLLPLLSKSSRSAPIRAAVGIREEHSALPALWDACFWTFAMPVAQSSFWVPRGSRQQTMVGMWLVASAIISTVYRSNLNAMLITPRLFLPFSNLGGLVKSGIPCLIYRGTLLHRNIEEAEEGTTLWGLNKVLISHNDIARGVHDMSQGKHALFTTNVGLLYVFHSYFLLTKTCTLYMTEDSYYGSKSLTLAFPKGSSLKDKVNPIIVNLREFGILERMFMKYVSHAKTCLHLDPNSVGNTLRPLQMGDMYGVCLVYVGGVTIAALTLLVECLVQNKTKQRSFKPES